MTIFSETNMGFHTDHSSLGARPLFKTGYANRHLFKCVHVLKLGSGDIQEESRQFSHYINLKNLDLSINHMSFFFIEFIK